jgi:RNA polymerase sigma factor (sigma-70 family)
VSEDGRSLAALWNALADGRGTGDNEWRELFSRTATDLHRFALTMLGGDEALAADVVQSVYLGVLRMMQHGSATLPSDVSAYLRKCVRHAVYDSLAQASKMEGHGETAAETAESTVDRFEVIEEDTWATVSAMLEPKDAELLRLLREGRAPAEIADILGVSIEAYAQRRHRLVRKIRQFVALKALSLSDFRE